MKIALGTVQFGLDYGVSNNSGKTAQKEVLRILEAASHSGVNVIDTASMYGDSEDVLGLSWPIEHFFGVVTKTPRLVDSGSPDLLERTLFRSLDRLKLESVYGLLVHNTDDLLTPQGCAIVERLHLLREQGVVKKIGVSVYSGRQIDSVLKIFRPDLVQLPLNVFDQRLLASGHLALLKKHGVEIHVRSIFLQGLLLMDTTRLGAYFKPYRELFRDYRSCISDIGLSPLQAALGFVSCLDEVDSVICGVENLHHFEEIKEASECSFNADFGRFAVNDEALINPSQWKLV